MPSNSSLHGHRHIVLIRPRCSHAMVPTPMINLTRTDSDTEVEVFLGSKVLCALFMKFALPPFTPPLPSVVQVSKHNMH